LSAASAQAGTPALKRGAEDDSASPFPFRFILWPHPRQRCADCAPL